MSKKRIIIIIAFFLLLLFFFTIFNNSQNLNVSTDTNVSQEQLTDVINIQEVKDTSQDTKIAEIAQEVAITQNEVKEVQKEVVQVREVVTKVVEVQVPAPTPAPVVVEQPKQEVVEVAPAGFTTETCHELRNLFRRLEKYTHFFLAETHCNFLFNTYGIQVYFEKNEIQLYTKNVFTKTATLEEAKQFIIDGTKTK